MGWKWWNIEESARIGPIAADRISQVLTTVLSAREIMAYYELLYRTEAKVVWRSVNLIIKEMNQTTVSANTSLYLEPELWNARNRSGPTTRYHHYIHLCTYKSIFVVPLCGTWCEIGNVAHIAYPTLGAHTIGLPQWAGSNQLKILCKTASRRRCFSKCTDSVS